MLNNYHKGFEIESLTSKGGNIAVKVLQRKKITNGYRLDVELIPPALENKTNFKDELYINIKGGEKLPISCKGYYSNVKIEPEIR